MEGRQWSQWMVRRSLLDIGTFHPSVSGQGRNGRRDRLYKCGWLSPSRFRLSIKLVQLTRRQKSSRALSPCSTFGQPWRTGRQLIELAAIQPCRGRCCRPGKLCMWKHLLPTYIHQDILREWSRQKGIGSPRGSLDSRLCCLMSSTCQRRMVWLLRRMYIQSLKTRHLLAII